MTQPPPDRPQPGPWTPPPPPDQPQWTTPAGAEPWMPQPAPTTSKRRVPLIASLVAVVALAGGGAATYVALSDSSDGSGAASPKAAVQHVLADLQKSDLIGLVGDLAPGERDALSTPLQDDFAKLKDLHVLNSDANANAISGVTFTAKNITYGAPITVNDHVQIVQLTGGTVSVSGDASKLPFSDQLRTVAKGRMSSSSGATGSSTANLATHHVRIATQKVNGRWYASIGYTIADGVAQHRIPTAADYVAPVGSDSPEAAVTAVVKDLLGGNAKDAIARVNPNELGVLHDYGGMLASKSGGAGGADLSTLELGTTKLSDGVTRVTLQHLVVGAGGSRISIDVSGSCVSVSAQGQTKNLCPDDVADLITQYLTAFSRIGAGTLPNDGAGQQLKLSAAQRIALTHLFAGVTKLGVATSQVGGKWYVDPIRSGADVFGTLFGGLQGQDYFNLSKLGR